MPREVETTDKHSMSIAVRLILFHACIWLLLASSWLLYATSARAEEMRIRADGFFGCRSVQVLIKIIMYSGKDHDEKAFEKAKEIAVNNSECTNFKANEPVFVTEWALPEFVKVRRQGDLDEYWTISTLVTKSN